MPALQQLELASAMARLTVTNQSHASTSATSCQVCAKLLLVIELLKPLALSAPWVHEPAKGENVASESDSWLTEAPTAQTGPMLLSALAL